MRVTHAVEWAMDRLPWLWAPLYWLAYLVDWWGYEPRPKDR